MSWDGRLTTRILDRNFSANVQFLENKTGEITGGTYLLSITSIVKSVQKIGTDALLIVDNYILSIIWRTDFIYLFDLHIKIKMAVNQGLRFISSFKIWHIALIALNDYPMTLYVQMQSIKVHCTVNANNDIKWSDCQQSSAETGIYKKVNIMEILKRQNKQWKEDMMIRKNL